MLKLFIETHTKIGYIVNKNKCLRTYTQSLCRQSSERSDRNQSYISSGLSKPLTCLPLESESPMFKLLRKESFGFVFILLAFFSIPLAEVFAFDNFSAHIISSKLTSPPEAMSLQIASSLNLYWVESIRKTHLMYLFSLCMLHYLHLDRGFVECGFSNLLT